MSSSTKTIDAIAIGTRRTGRSLTLRLQPNELDELVFPTHPREWKCSLKESFKDPRAFRILIEDIRRLDSEFSSAIDENPMNYVPTSSTRSANIIKYQEYIDVFVAIFAQFPSKEIEGDKILDALKSQKCPSIDIFRRLVVNPNFVVREDSDLEGPEPTEMLDSEGKKIPVSQLARICDVSILRFLSNVTEKTSPQAIHWALDYIYNMTNRLDESLKDHSDSGWYGISFRKRKSTIRNSTTEVPQLALDGRPLVIGVGSSGPIVTPETGQPAGISISSSIVPSIAITEHEEASVRTMSFGNASVSSLGSELSLQIMSDDRKSPVSMEERKSPVPTLPELRNWAISPVGRANDEELRPRPPVIQESQNYQPPYPPQQRHQPPPPIIVGGGVEGGAGGGRGRRHSVATRPPVMQFPLEKSEPQRARRQSTGSKPSFSTGNPIQPKRKTSIVEPIKAMIESISEEANEASNYPSSFRPVSPQFPITSTSSISGSTDNTPTVPSSPGAHRRALSPIMSQDVVTASSLDRPQTRSQDNVAASTLDRPTTRSPSPLLQSHSRGTSPPSDVHLSDDSDGKPDNDLSDTDGADGGSQKQQDADISIHYKHKPRNLRYGGPSALSAYTTEIMKNELHTLITHNGRISLLAILVTISKLPSNPQLWTEDNWDACKVCISLIQFCVDFGLDTQKKNENEEMKKSPFIHQRGRCVRSDPRIEKPSLIYSKLILKHSVLALIHCAVSTYTGCLVNSCRINKYYARNASQNLNKMVRQLERLYSNSPLQFRESLMEFANNTTLKRVFHFLHVILQYCPRGPGRELDLSTSRRDSLIVLSATVLRIVVDRMVLLNLSEPFIEHCVVKEAMSFIHFTYTLFNHDLLNFTHLQWYVNRVALSILLPIRPQQGVQYVSSINSGLALADLSTSGTFPRRSKKNKGEDSGEDSLKRKRGHTINYGVPPPENATQSPILPHKNVGTSSRNKPKLVKQTSVHSDSEGHDDAISDNNDHIILELQKEWRGLHLGVLHQRIRRLSVMMNLMEPGAIPDGSLLASLISVGPPGSLIPRALVLLECSLFVHKLNNEEMTVWMKNQPSRYCGSWDLFKTLKGWGEAIGEALSACEITEKELFSKGTSDLDTSNFAEEPVFSDEERNPDKRYIVNYSLKMMACTLLVEITKFCREPPPAFLPTSLPATSINRSTSTQSNDRKPSNISVMSSDSDTNPSPSPSFSTAHRQGSLDYYRKGSSPLLEDVGRFLSTDHPSSPNTSSRVSMYLRVSSRHGKKHPRTQSHGSQTTTSRSKTHQPQVEIPSDSFRIVSPSKTARRMSVSAAAFLNQPQLPDSHGSSIRYRGRPSVSIHQNVLRRKSISDGSVLKPNSTRRENSSPTLSHADISKGNVQAAVTPPTSHRLASPQPIRRRQSVLGKVFQHGRQMARRGRRHPTQSGDGSSKARVSTTTNTSSAASSPSMMHQRSMSHSKADALYDSELEGIKNKFPWLDVVEHMIVSFYSTSSELQERRKRSCSEMMVALKYIFSLKFEKENKSAAPSGEGSSAPPTATQPIYNPSATKTRPSVVETGLATAFSNITLIPDAQSANDKTGTSGSRTTGSIIRPPPPKPVSSSEMPRSLGKLDFSGVRLRRFLESGIAWGSELNDKFSLKDILGDENEMLHLSIDYMLETDSSYSIDEILQSFNNVRLNYVSTFLAGLLHAPFSLLTYGAPVLQPSSFRDLQESSWIALCDQDYEYADAAASFFLLCCVKDKENMYSFLKSKAKTNHPVAIRDAVTRFEILWRCRDGVWSRMEQSAPKLFKLDDETTDPIGYSLPSQLLGIPGESLPHAPWKPVSICTRDHSKDNVQCYQGTKHAPLEHLSNVVNATRLFPVSGSSVVQMEVDTTPAVVNSNALLELDREEYEQGRIKVKDVYKLSTLFPSNILPLITLVIKALQPPYGYTEVLLKADAELNIPSITQISSMAEDLLWHCMLDNSYYLFYPLLNQFNVLYKVIKDNKRKPKLTVEDSAAELLEGILKPFHILLSHFPRLPPKASHMLFNNFIGIIMRHTEQPVVMSDAIIHSVLTLLRLVVPSMKGLTMKELKNQLKKESCYTTILTTARIRGVEKIRLVYENKPGETKDIAVQDNEKFIDVIQRESEGDDQFSALYLHYLTEEKKSNRTILNSLVIQDHYPATVEGAIPTFTLHKSTSTKNAMKEQGELLRIHKMTELARVMFTIEMMKLDTSSIGLQQEFAQPNPTFVLSELQGLNSFPRKTLSSLLDEVGLAGLREWDLRMVDTMLRGVWSKFILNLFIKVKDYQPTDNVVLFLTVINGSLLLQAEDSSTLRYSLASLLIAAKKFEPVFRQNAYQMIVPMLLRVYSLHSRNKMVKDAIKFLWACFYSLGRNTFLLQAIVSVANLFSSSVANIATKMKVNYCPLCVDWEADEQITIVRSVVELLETLDCNSDKLPPDKLDILGACPEDSQLRDLLSQWNGCSMEQIVPFCVTVASFNPEVLRGMQVLVFLDHIMLELIRLYIRKYSFVQIATSIRSLIKGCESLKRSIKLIPRGVQANSNFDDQLDPSSTRSKAYIKQMFSKRRSGTSQSLQNVPAKEKSVSELPTDEQQQKYFEGFRSRNLQNINQQIITLSRDSLLSIASQLILHAPSDDTPISRNPFDALSLMNVCSITEKVLRLVSKSSQDNYLESRGIASVFDDLLPKVTWDAENVSAFFLLLERVYKIFRKLQGEYLSSHHTCSIPWNDLTKFVNSIQSCVFKCPSLVTDNDQILAKIRAIMEICLSSKLVAGVTSPSKKRSALYFVQDAPPEFITSFVRLCAEMIVRTGGLNAKHRILLSGLFENALDFKHNESTSVWEKIFLPLSVNLGIRDEEEDYSYVSDEDITFILENISKMTEHVQVVIERVKLSSQKDQITRYFTCMKILLSAYCNYFSQEQWMTIGYSLLASTSKFDPTTANELYFEFCFAFLNFWESFLLPWRLPIFSILWHVVSTIRYQLHSIKKNEASVGHVVSDALESSLNICEHLINVNYVFQVTLGKREFLLTLQKESLPTGAADLTLGGSTHYSKLMGGALLPDGMDLEKPDYSWSTVNQPSLKRKNSKAPNFPAIDEMGETDVTLSSPDPLGKKDERQLGSSSSNTGETDGKSPQMHPSRPTTLSFKPKPDSIGASAGNIGGSPKLFKGRVSFSDKVNERSPTSRRFFTSSSRQQQPKSSPIVETSKRKAYKPPQQRRLIRVGGKDKSESGFEADEEDASLETPRSSISYPPGQFQHVSSTSSSINSSLASHSPLNLAEVSKTLVVAAEIHELDEISMSSNEPDQNDDTSLSSNDEGVSTISRPKPSPKHEQTSTSVTKKPPEVLSKPYHSSPSNTRRHVFKYTKHATVDEQPDEQTGQINHSQRGGGYMQDSLKRQACSEDTSLSHRLTSQNSPPSRASGRMVDNMYERSLKQADLFLGHKNTATNVNTTVPTTKTTPTMTTEEKLPLYDDDCSV